jgi:hypothetical protein
VLLLGQASVSGLLAIDLKIKGKKMVKQIGRTVSALGYQIKKIKRQKIMVKQIGLLVKYSVTNKIVISIDAM